MIPAEGQAVMVSGANRGIGRAIAERLRNTQQEAKMRSFWCLAILAAAWFATLASLVAPASAANCPFGPWMTYEGTQLRRDAQTGAYLYITGLARVDADGAPNAYHPDDVGRPCGPTGAGLDCPANAGYPNASWWPSVLTPDPSNPSKAYVQPSGPFRGFLVSKTALTATGNPNERDPARYVNATATPYLVFPGPFYRMRGTGKLGDLGVAYHLASGKSTAFIVADVGPAEPLGEGSIALFEALGGQNVNPRTGGGVAPGDVAYVVFPNSVKERPTRWPVGQQEINRRAEALLEGVGGMPVFEACRP
jgi:hypothetical protein